MNSTEERDPQNSQALTTAAMVAACSFVYRAHDLPLPLLTSCLSSDFVPLFFVTRTTVGFPFRKRYDERRAHQSSRAGGGEKGVVGVPASKRENWVSTYVLFPRLKRWAVC